MIVREAKPTAKRAHLGGGGGRDGGDGGNPSELSDLSGFRLASASGWFGRYDEMN